MASGSAASQIPEEPKHLPLLTDSYETHIISQRMTSYCWGEQVERKICEFELKSSDRKNQVPIF